MRQIQQKREMAESFEALGVKDNFYQSTAFFPMPFALITTINEDGITSIGPHSLVFPLDISESHSMLLVSRAGSNTATNLRNGSKCALNYIEFDRQWLTSVVALGYPGQAPDAKMRDVPFELIGTPDQRFAADPKFPLIMQDAFQVFECEVDESFNYRPKREAQPQLVETFFALRVENILMKQSWKRKLDQREEFPDMPISYGFRGGKDFWFARHGKPFGIPIPRGKGQSSAGIYYMANKLDPKVRFTEGACKKLAEVPPAFIDVVLEGIIEASKAQSISMVSCEFLRRLEAQRSG
jgi:flavin reductase (DIM6/NTAB) family NADH-FMN oxidoreductase RutF